MNGQVVFASDPAKSEVLELPGPTVEVVPRVPWGRFDALFTPAYWAAQVWLDEGKHGPDRHRLGRTLLEEVVACVVGGHGMPAETCLAAFRRIRDSGLLGRKVPGSGPEYAALLSMPLPRSTGKPVLYRFANQKAKYLEKIHRAFFDEEPPCTDVLLRQWLMRLPGIGPKTASWVVRNYLDSDRVAILDIHILRACLLAGVIHSGLTVERDYFEIESRFLDLAAAINVRPSVLDAVMWEQMRQAPTVVQELLNRIPTSPENRICVRRSRLKRTDKTTAECNYSAVRLKHG